MMANFGSYHRDNANISDMNCFLETTIRSKPEYEGNRNEAIKESEQSMQSEICRRIKQAKNAK